MKRAPSDNRHIVFMRLMPPVITWGGLEKLMLDWFERIDFTQCRVTLVVSTGGGDIYRRHLSLKQLPVDVVEFPFRVNFRYTDHFFVRWAKTLQLLKKLKADQVVFSHGSFFCFDLSHVLAANMATNGNVYVHDNLGAPAPSVKTSRKYFGVIPGAGLWWYAERYLTPLRAKFAKKIFTVSREIRQRMIELWHYPPEKVEVLYHGVELSRFFPSQDIRRQLRPAMGIDAHDTVIIAASRLSQEKCVERTIEAFDRLWQQYPKALLLVAGAGPKETELRALAGQKPSAARIRFLGYVDNLNELYQISDIYVLASDNEGLSLAFLEALASGIIVVSTNCTGAGEVIENDQNGFLTEKSTEGILNGLQKAIRLTEVERRAMTHKAVELIQRNFEINRNIQTALIRLNIPQKVTP